MSDSTCPRGKFCPTYAGTRQRTLPDGRAAIQVPNGECACEVDHLHDFMGDHSLEWFSQSDGIDIKRPADRADGDSVITASVDHWVIADPDGFDGFQVQATIEF